MGKALDDVLAALSGRFGEVDFAPAPLNPEVDRFGVQMCVRAGAEKLHDVMRFCRDDDRCRFEQLCDLTCVDYLNFPEATDRFGVTYSLLSLSLEHRLWIKCLVNDPKPHVPTVTDIWRGAEWMEREVWDMFGVRFDGHGDLRRILTWEGFEAHPLRKDYPLRGRGERENFPVVTRESTDVVMESSLFPMRRDEDE